MRFRLYPIPEQEIVLLEHCAHARYVWNLALEQRNLYRPGHQTPNWAEQSRQLTEARSCTWLNEGSSIVQHQALRDLDQAFQNWWRGSHRHPTWRRKGQHEGFRIQDGDGGCVPTRLNRKWGHVLVPKLGRVKFRWTRDPGKPKSYRIKRDAAGHWWVSFAVIPEPIPAPGNGKTVGIDRGVVVSAATSEGVLHSAPRAVHPRRLHLERHQARAQLGSSRRARVRRELAKVRAKEADRRKDWVEKLSTDLARGYDVIRVEDLSVKHMLETRTGRTLHRGIAESGWGLLVRRLEDKAPGRVEKVEPAFTSMTCSECGHVDPLNRSKSHARFFGCRACGYTEHADVNAAKVIAGRQPVTARGRPTSGRLKREPQPA